VVGTGRDSAVLREYLYSLIDWTDVQSVLDVGCGDGYDLGHIANMIPSATASFMGIDGSPDKIEAARSTYKGDSRFAFLEADADSALQFPNSYFDVIISCDMIECLRDKKTFLKEVHRVLNTDGQFMCTHFDWDTQVINAGNKDLVRRVVHAWCDWKQPWMTECDGWTGRRLHGIIDSTQLFHGDVRAFVLTNTEFAAQYYGFARIHDFAAMAEHGRIERMDYDDLIRDVRETATRGEYFYSITHYAYVGRKR
jgi:ubiquinone/menaquinone biosynthesis C-methylase UbiE